MILNTESLVGTCRSLHIIRQWVHCGQLMRLCTPLGKVAGLIDKSREGMPGGLMLPRVVGGKMKAGGVDDAKGCWWPDEGLHACSGCCCKWLVHCMMVVDACHTRVARCQQISVRAPAAWAGAVTDFFVSFALDLLGHTQVGSC